MDENRTNVMAEFQRLRLETSGISQNLMVSTRSVDARRKSSSSSNNEVLKVMNENHNAIRKEIEEVQRKLTEDNQNQNELIKELLEELRLARMEIAGIKKQQEEDRRKMENVKTITSPIQETLKKPKTVELCGYWTLSPEESRCSNVQLRKFRFSKEGNMLTWWFWKDESQHRCKMRIGSNECKIREDGKIEFRYEELKFELEVKEEKLTIEHNDKKTVYIKSNA